MDTRTGLFLIVSQALDSVHGNGSTLFMPKTWVDRIKEKSLEKDLLNDPVQNFLSTLTYTHANKYVRLSKAAHDDLIDCLKQ